MRSLRQASIFLLAVGLFFTLIASSHAGAGIVNGLIRFETARGTIASAEWTRVYLVSGEVPVPDAEIEHGLLTIAVTDRITTTHQRFYARLQQHLQTDGFLVDSTLASHDGSFRFAGIDPGRYFLVVAFPSSLDGYKVAWQVAVDVEGSRSVSIELNRGNLVLPTFSRRFGAAVIDAGM